MTIQPLRTGVLGANSTAFLDLARAIAANLVLFGHALDLFGLRHSLSAGAIGVGIFFILSGFLIMQSSLARIQHPGPYLLPYIIDRFARIFSAYLPTLILVAVLNASVDLGHWGQRGSSTGPLAFVGNLFLLQDYPLFQASYRIFGISLRIRSYNTAEPFWTIPIEFWIYVGFGLTFFVLAVRERVSVIVNVVLATVSLPVVIWNTAGGGGNGLTLVWAIGALGGYFWGTAWHKSAHKLQIGRAILLGTLICLVGRGLRTGWNFQDLGMVLCELTILLSVLSIIEAMPPFPPAILRLCTFLASYSYSLYLVHNSVLIIAHTLWSSTLGWLTLPVAILVAHATAYLIYQLFERHYRTVGKFLKLHTSDVCGSLTPRRIDSS